jgi:DNA polymerase IIIc chi subunit
MSDLNTTVFKDATELLVVPLSSIPSMEDGCKVVAERNYRRGYYDAWMYAMGRLDECLPPSVNDQLWQYLRERLLPWKLAGSRSDATQPYLPPTFRPSGQRAKEREPRVSKEGFVYLLQAEGQTPVKIGHGGNVVERKKALQSGNAQQLNTLRVIPSADAHQLEQQLHKRYATYRVRREWFDLPAAILNALLKEGFE